MRRRGDALAVARRSAADGTPAARRGTGSRGLTAGCASASLPRRCSGRSTAGTSNRSGPRSAAMPWCTLAYVNAGRLQPCEYSAVRPALARIVACRLRWAASSFRLRSVAVVQRLARPAPDSPRPSDHPVAARCRFPSGTLPDLPPASALRAAGMAERRTPCLGAGTQRTTAGLWPANPPARQTGHCRQTACFGLPVAVALGNFEEAQRRTPRPGKVADGAALPRAMAARGLVAEVPLPQPPRSAPEATPQTLPGHRDAKSSPREATAQREHGCFGKMMPSPQGSTPTTRRTDAQRSSQRSECRAS
jgi:hypothetical protein